MFNVDYRFHSDISSNDSDIGNYVATTSNINVQTFQSPMTLFINALLFLVIATRKELRRKKSHQFFLHLQLIHMALSIICIISNYYFWLLNYIITNSLLLAMFCSLMLTTGDRFFAIKFPSRYNLVTSKSVILVLVSSWVPTLIFVTVVRSVGISSNGLKVIHIAIIGFSSVVLAASNVKVYIIARNHDRFVKENSMCRKRIIGEKNKLLKASYVCFAIVFNFIIFWMPYCIHDIMELTHMYESTNQNIFDIIVEQIALLNSLSDPILFIILSTHTRREIKKLFKLFKLFKRNGNIKDTML